MSIYSSFFTPQTISILLCLHQSVKQNQQIDPKSAIIQFLIKKILKLTQQTNIQTTNEAFEAEMFSIVNDIDFLEQYRQLLGQINSFNTFYKEISNILKNLRSLKNNKLQQGNVIDFLIRRLYIYFQKLDFKQIVTIYQNFNSYREGQSYKMRQNQFMLTKSIEQVKFNLQNYRLKENPQQINKIIQNLAQNDHTFKISYVKGLYKAQQKKPNQSEHFLHRYFDRCLGNLFQQKTQTSPMSNKINHCILSSAYSSLKMGHLQQCLQAISQGLRISQNNSDQESINNCIIYLYKIAEQLGKYQQEILLAQHAITHSLNLSNLVLMVYSCLCYSVFEKKYNCQDSEVTLLKSRHINWTDALHFSKKKIYSNFQSNCKNIYHSFRSLLIPTFLHKLSILIHIPHLNQLLLNPYYNRKELYDLEVYQQFLGNNHEQKQLKKAKLYLNLNQPTLLNHSLQKLNKLQKESTSPETLVKIMNFKCQVKIAEGVQIDTYKYIQQLISTCKKYGFVKSNLVVARNYLNKVLIDNELYYDALVKIQQTIKFCQENSIEDQKIICYLYKAQVHSALNNIGQALLLIQLVEEEGKIQTLNTQNLQLFWASKQIITKKICQIIDKDINLLNEANQLKKTQYQCLNNLLKCYLKEGNIKKVQQLIKYIRDFIIMNPHTVNERIIVQENLKKILLYIQKVKKVYEKLTVNGFNKQEFDEETIHRKVMLKISLMYSN